MNARSQRLSARAGLVNALSQLNLRVSATERIAKQTTWNDVEAQEARNDRLRGDNRRAFERPTKTVLGSVRIRELPNSQA